MIILDLSPDPSFVVPAMAVQYTQSHRGQFINQGATFEFIDHE
jgi:hypothetical protein